jgi:hypothetical protein
MLGFTIFFGMASGVVPSFGWADLPKFELTATIKGLSGNTGGVPITGGKVRYEFVEANVVDFYSSLHLGVGVRQDFNTDNLVVPNIWGGLDVVPVLEPIVGLGLEIMTPKIFDSLSFGVRLDQYAYINWTTGEIVPLITLGVTCHF